MNVLDNSVMIKGSNSGITVFLDSEMAFEDLLESVSEKFKSASKFFNNANMAISFDGRDLSAEEEKRILNVISDVSELNIVCVLDENNNMKEIYEDAVKKAIASVDVSEPVVQPVNDMVSDPKTACMFYKGTLRSGQVFESDGSVVVLGDVNPGGKVVASVLHQKDAKAHPDDAVQSICPAHSYRLPFLLWNLIKNEPVRFLLLQTAPLF